MLGRIRRRQELRAAQDRARSGKVTLARQYRAGEMPDIQSITLQSFLAPLGESINSLACLADPVQDHGRLGISG